MFFGCSDASEKEQLDISHLCMMTPPWRKTHSVSHTVEAAAAKTLVSAHNCDRRTIHILFICLSDMSRW